MSKRIFDIVFSFLSLMLLIPILFLIGFVIKIYMPGHVIFKQKRIGRFEKPFLLYKFRTMFENNIGDTISFKGDKRITPLGAILRKHKLDELPELWNILKGDMSFVGPRPDVLEYIEKLEDNEKQYLSIRPGLTSPASIKYSNEEDLLALDSNPQKYYNEVVWPDKVKLNLEYYKNRTFLGDIFLIIKTVFRKQIRKVNSSYQ